MNIDNMARVWLANSWLTNASAGDLAPMVRRLADALEDPNTDEATRRALVEWLKNAAKLGLMQTALQDVLQGALAPEDEA